MESVWEKSPVRQRQSEALLEPYVEGLIRQGEVEQAINLIEQYLRKAWSDALVYQYGRLQQGDLLKRLALAEKWLKHHRDNPWLLLTLGRLAKANSLWTKAEEYLRQSLTHGPRGETYQVLAEVLTEQGKPQAAAETYKTGLDLMLDQTATRIK